MLREGLIKGVEVQHTDFGTERLKGKDGRETRVSSISIRLSLPEKGAEEGFYARSLFRPKTSLLIGPLSFFTYWSMSLTILRP